MGNRGGGGWGLQVLILTYKQAPRFGVLCCEVSGVSKSTRPVAASRAQTKRTSQLRFVSLIWRGFMAVFRRGSPIFFRGADLELKPATFRPFFWRASRNCPGGAYFIEDRRSGGAGRIEFYL